MKYAETKVDDLSRKTLAALERIAMEADCVLEARGGIEVRYNDEEDFPEIGVYALQKMLERAYLLDKAEGRDVK